MKFREELLTPQRNLALYLHNILLICYWHNDERLDIADRYRSQKDTIVEQVSQFLSKIETPPQDYEPLAFLGRVVEEMNQIMSEWKSDTLPEFLLGLDALYIRARVLHDALDETWSAVEPD